MLHLPELALLLCIALVFPPLIMTKLTSSINSVSKTNPKDSSSLYVENAPLNLPSSTIVTVSFLSSKPICSLVSLSFRIS